MLPKFNKLKLKKKISFDTSSVIILLQLTNTHREALETLKKIFQEYNLTLMRIKGHQFANNFLSFSHLFTNSGFVAWSDNFRVEVKGALLDQLLNAKVIPLVFFYRGQIWTVSRLKKMGTGFLQPSNSVIIPCSLFWSNFHKNFF